MPITRRNFLTGVAGTTAAATLGACSRNGSSDTASKATATSVGQARSAAGSSASGKGILVLLTLYGGNDGLDTVIPADSSAYQSARGDLARSPEEVLDLGEGLGLHPALKKLKGVWDDGRLAVVRGVGIGDEDRSHFHCMDYWQTAGQPDGVGWLGRWLDSQPHDPMRAIAVGNELPLLLQGEKGAGALVATAGARLPTDRRLLELFGEMSAAERGAPELLAAAAVAGTDLLSVARAVGQATRTRESAGSKADAGSQGAAAEASDEPAPQAGGDASQAYGYESSGLHLVSQLIAAKSPTRVYAVSMGGFDTHAGEKATHDRLMAGLDAQVGGFLDDLGDVPVTLVAYSEFGRRVDLNGSGGTDHGTAGPVFVAGPNVKGGFIGDEPSLTKLVDGDLRGTVDFRSVYATVLADVLGTDPAATLGGKKVKALPLLR